MTTKKKPPTPGHKLAGYSFGVGITCECGWRSATFFGKGARAEALGDWEWHKQRCAKEQAHG